MLLDGSMRFCFGRSPVGASFGLVCSDAAREVFGSGFVVMSGDEVLLLGEKGEIKRQFLIMLLKFSTHNA